MKGFKRKRNKANGKFANWIALLLQNPLIKPLTKCSVYLFFLLKTPLYVLPIPFSFLQESLHPLSMIFKTPQLPINMECSHYANERQKNLQLSVYQVTKFQNPENIVQINYITSQITSKWSYIHLFPPLPPKKSNL